MSELSVFILRCPKRWDATDADEREVDKYLNQGRFGARRSRCQTIVMRNNANVIGEYEL